MRNIISRNPYTGEIKEQISFFTQEALKRCLQRTESAFNLHSKRSAKERTTMIGQLIPQIQRKRDEISKLITFETGKPIIQAQNEVKQALKVCEYYSKRSDALHSLNTKSSAKKKTLVKYVPNGTVLCILPFTNPFALTLYHALPQLLVGNCVIVKNTATTPTIGRIIEQMMAKSGFQSGEYQNFFANRTQCLQILGRKQIVGVNFTGSTQSGRAVAQAAGKNLKMSSLQLSSNDAMIVMEDANLDLAVQNALKIGFYNGGQGGSNAKRIIIKASSYEQFKTKLIEKAKSLRYGNPLYRQTQIGPLARPDLHEKLEAQLKSLPNTFKILYQKPSIQKPFFPITIIEAQSNTFDEEILGPAFILHKANDNTEAIGLANKTKFGNNHYVFSANKSNEIVEYLRGGSVYVNQTSIISSHIPKGGINDSGYGREGGQEGIRKFANIKTVYIN